MKIQTRIILMVTFSLFIASAAISILTISRIEQTGNMIIKWIENLHKENVSQMRVRGEKRSAEFRKELMSQKKEYLKSQVQTAISVLEKAYNDVMADKADKADKAQFDEEQSKKDVLSLIEHLKYGPENFDYFWINDIEPKMVMHPYKPDLNGKNLKDFADPNGKHLFVEFVKTCQKNGEGFVDYYWPKYGAKIPQPKLSFVKLFKPWNWIIGTGIYIDDIDSSIKLREQDLKKRIDLSIVNTNKLISIKKDQIRENIRKVIWEAATLTILILMLVWVFASILTRKKIIYPIRSIIDNLYDISRVLATSADQISSGSQTMAQSASEQAASVEESSASIEIITGMSLKTSEMTRGAEQLMLKNIEKSGKSLKSLMELTKSMAQIEDESDKISQVIKNINEIAFQTHLLALNASVEAARAGAAGTGFAVVAGEVKSLATKTADAAEHTQNLLSSTLKQVTKAARSIKEVSEDFTGIIESATLMGEKTAKITKASKDQAVEIEQVCKSSSSIDNISQQVAANAEESAATAEALADHAWKMESIVDTIVSMAGRTQALPTIRKIPPEKIQ